MKIGVVGAGSWGTTLANLLAGKGFEVVLWVYEEDRCEEIKARRTNSIYLPDFSLSERIIPTNSLEDAVASRDLIVWVTPSHVARTMLEKALPYISGDAILVNATKGIEDDTLKVISEVMDDVLPRDLSEGVVYLSGPSFAREVAARHPTAVTVASRSMDRAQKVQEVFSTAYFRVYTAADVTGVVVGGAIKNVIALGAGISDGLGFGYNARAALITRGLAEMTRLGAAMGAEPLTLAGLSGLGDLVLTCTGDLSRNRTVGLRLGRGERLESILGGMKMVAEGVRTAKAAYRLSRKLEVEMPITEKIYRILYEGMSPKAAVAGLMSRELKPEISL